MLSILFYILGTLGFFSIFIKDFTTTNGLLVMIFSVLCLMFGFLIEAIKDLMEELE